MSISSFVMFAFFPGLSGIEYRAIKKYCKLFSGPFLSKIYGTNRQLCGHGSASCIWKCERVIMIMFFFNARGHLDNSLLIMDMFSSAPIHKLVLCSVKSPTEIWTGQGNPLAVTHSLNTLFITFKKEHFMDKAPHHQGRLDQIQVQD